MISATSHTTINFIAFAFLLDKFCFSWEAFVLLDNYLRSSWETFMTISISERRYLPRIADNRLRST